MAPSLTTYDALLACLALFVAYLIYQKLKYFSQCSPSPTLSVYIRTPSISPSIRQFHERAARQRGRESDQFSQQNCLIGRKIFSSDESSNPHFNIKFRPGSLLFCDPTPLFVSPVLPMVVLLALQAIVSNMSPGITAARFAQTDEPSLLLLKSHYLPRWQRILTPLAKNNVVSISPTCVL